MKLPQRIVLYAGIGVVALAATLELPHAKHFRQTALVEQLDIPALAVRSDQIITGTVTKKLGTVREIDPTGEDMVYTRWQIQPSRAIKGSKPGRVIVRTMGGQYLTTIVDAEDQPDFRVGEQVIVFLKQIDGWNGDYRVVGEFQGKFRLENRNGKTITVQSETKKEQEETTLEQLVSQQ